MKYAQFHGTQEEQIDRLRSQGWRIIKAKKCKAVAAIETHKRGFTYKVWQGNAAKPCAHYIARDEKRLEVGITHYFNSQERHERERAKRAAERKGVDASKHYSTGDVVYNSWGYEQTNIDFYQVLKVNKSSVTLRRIAQNSNDHGGASGGHSQPCRNEFLQDSKPFTKRLQKDGWISFRHGACSKWTGKAVWCSSYY